ncbi:uncharacterized protein LOC144118638 isoform X1 [Amblyomma americanum]
MVVCPLDMAEERIRCDYCDHSPGYQSRMANLASQNEDNTILSKDQQENLLKDPGTTFLYGEEDPNEDCIKKNVKAPRENGACRTQPVMSDANGAYYCWIGSCFRGLCIYGSLSRCASS